jgi:hypothetical protein
MGADDPAPALELARATRLLPGLRRLCIAVLGETWQLSAAERAAFRGGLFAHIDEVHLPIALRARC